MLGFRSNPKARKVVPPPGEGCWRKVLGDVDPEELAKALNAWMQSQSKKDALPDLLSIDGKVIASNLATIVSLIDATDGSPHFIHSPRTQPRTHRHQRRAFYPSDSNTGKLPLYPIRHTN
jgi:hypothetical protein